MRRIRLAIGLFLALGMTVYAGAPEARYIAAGEYFNVVKGEIDGAKASVRVYMYLFALTPDQPNSLTNQLAESLKKAHDRGVDVEVVLDRNINFGGEAGPGNSDPEGKNLAAYDYLKANGVPVSFDDGITLTHAKAVVIDGETVITGSTNWSKSALTQNVESNVLVRNGDVARDLLRDMARSQPAEPGAVAAGTETVRGGTVALPWGFFKSEKHLGEMVRRHDENAFDAYLYFLEKDRGKGEKMLLSYGDLGKFLGLEASGREDDDTRREINRVLGVLQDRYGLLKVKKQFGKKAEVTMGGAKPWSEADFAMAPEAFWRWGWNRELNFPGRVMYLAGLYFEHHSPERPVWSVAGEDMAKQLSVSRWFVSQGVGELRRKNLWEAEYGALSRDGSAPRDITRYTVNPLYDPAKLKKGFEDLAEKYGGAETGRARKFAALVYEDSDIAAIERLILLENEYGQDKMDRAAKILGEKNVDNPRRTMGYFINTVRGLK